MTEEQRQKHRECNARYAAENPDKARAWAKACRARNPEKFRERSREAYSRRRAANEEGLKAQRREFYERGGKAYFAEYQKQHRAERAAANARYRAANPDRVRDSYLRRRYGITLAEYDALHEAQGGLCAICRRPERRVCPRAKAVSRLAVDHCHRTGRVRELLCWSCNTAIGALDHDASLLAAAESYLKAYS